MNRNRKWLFVLLIVFLIHLAICVYAVATYEPGTAYTQM